MIADISFWQEFGPRIIAAIALLIVATALFIIGRGSGRAYESLLQREHDQYLRSTAKRRRARQETHVERQADLLSKSRQARTAQLVGTALGIIALGGSAWFGVGALTTLLAWQQWLVTLVVLAGVAILGGWLPWRRYQQHQREVMAGVHVPNEIEVSL